MGAEFARRWQPLRNLVKHCVCREPATTSAYRGEIIKFPSVKIAPNRRKNRARRFYSARTIRSMR